MPPTSLSRESAQHFYDRVGGLYNWFSGFEAKAKALATRSLALAPGLKLLNVGLGTGREQQEFINQLSPGGYSVGIDLSPRMLQIARSISPGWLCRADGGYLPFLDRNFDRLYCAYVLDLISKDEISSWLEGFRRVMKQGGRMVILSLTEGTDPASRVIMELWEMVYALNPSLCGGCRPLDLTQYLPKAGFECRERIIVNQLGIPSTVIVAS
jgi:ubiquinone/menaquinone biosynthesis C-methylase UbiE